MFQEINKNGIDYVLIPKEEFDNGKFFNELELARLENKINRFGELAISFQQEMEK